jgi:hypothetical protein
MPIDWKKPEATSRLLAAVYGALGEEPVCPEACVFVFPLEFQGQFLLFSRTTSGIFRAVPSKRK